MVLDIPSLLLNPIVQFRLAPGNILSNTNFYAKEISFLSMPSLVQGRWQNIFFSFCLISFQQLPKARKLNLLLISFKLLTLSIKPKHKNGLKPAKNMGTINYSFSFNILMFIQANRQWQAIPFLSLFLNIPSHTHTYISLHKMFLYLLSLNLL